MQRVQGKEEVGGRQVIGFRNERKIRYMNIIQTKSRVSSEQGRQRLAFVRRE